MADTADATPPVKLSSRRPRSNTSAARVVAAAFSNNANAGAGADAAKAKIKTKTVESRSRSATAASIAAVTSGGSANVTTRTLSVAFQSPPYCVDTSKVVRSVSPAAAEAAFWPAKKRSSNLVASVRGKVPGTGQNAHRRPAAPTITTPTPPESSASNRKRTATAARSTAYDATSRRASVDGAPPGVVACSAPPPSRASPRRSAFMSSSARFSLDARSHRFAFACPASPSASPVSSSRSTPAASSPLAAVSPSPAKKKKKRPSLFTGLLSSPFSRLSLTNNKQQQSPTSKPVGSLFRTTAEISPYSRPRRSTELPALAVKAAIKSEEEHRLRLLYTRHLQWRHANAKAAAARSSQRAAAQKTLYGAWIAVLRERKSVAVAKIQLQLLRNSLRLVAILRGQMTYLEEWSSLERLYANSLSGTDQALNATVVRLPVSDGAVVDVQALKNAVGSALHVMQSITISTSTQLSKLAQANVLVSRLSGVAIQEFVLMVRCRELLSTLASMHVKHCSLQGQMIQLNQRRERRFQ
ncbi:hypothetical protein QOZ80_7AG0552900 [Eleusine coracana subsp. coracana]|nr:hypothetical protein QOZ80_7AG0552900 [Eleusine coracana subsp. coracana]